MIIHYDGSLAGLLTVCHRSIARSQAPEAICRPPWLDPGLFDLVEDVMTDRQTAAALRARICRDISARCVDTVRLAFLSEHPGIELFLWRYLALGWKLGARLDSCLAHPDVHTVHCWARRTAHEGHRLKGLARFRETADGTLYAPLRADANVLPLLAPHFARRLDRPWVLHDVARGIGAIGRDGRYLLGTLNAPDEICWSADEMEWQELWRAFHRRIAIPERISKRRQRQFMPMKYWEYLIEQPRAV